MCLGKEQRKGNKLSQASCLILQANWNSLTYLPPGHLTLESAALFFFSHKSLQTKEWRSPISDLPCWIESIFFLLCEAIQSCIQNYILILFIKEDVRLFLACALLRQHKDSLGAYPKVTTWYGQMSQVTSRKYDLNLTYLNHCWRPKLMFKEMWSENLAIPIAGIIIIVY